MPGSLLLYQVYQPWLRERILNRSASLAMPKNFLEFLPGNKLDIKRHSPSVLYMPHIPHPLRVTWLLIDPLHGMLVSTHIKYICFSFGFGNKTELENGTWIDEHHRSMFHFPALVS